MCVCVCLTEALVESSRLVNNFPDRAAVLCSVDVRGQTWPDPPSIETLQSWSFELPYFPGSVAPGRGQWDWQRPPGKHRESFICSSCSDRHIRGLPQSFRHRLSMADGFPQICLWSSAWQIWEGTYQAKLSLIGDDLILYLRFDCQLSYFLLYATFWDILQIFLLQKHWWI